MAKKTPNNRASRPDEDNPEWTKEDFARARPAAEVLPEFIGEKATQELMRRSRGRPRKADRKVNQTLRLDQEVLEAYRREGRGWQTRINEVLRQHMPQRPR
ncbi:MAG TPA: BrnA antitoxin family protein [Candidatus Binataceae bacterium]|nr:BrnA antitoxin family protein [Candidatus Binataceae bacterium]